MNRKLTISLLAFCIASAACGSIQSMSTPTPVHSTTTPTSAAEKLAAISLRDHARRIDRNVVYCTASDVDLKLDLYFPKSDSGQVPVVVYVHGGGWNHGDKHDASGLIDFAPLLDAGFLVASVNYRLAPQYQFPAMIYDVKCAIRFLRAQAAAYRLNPDHIGAWGDSAGGHLVSLLATADSTAGFDTGPYLDQSSRIQAAVDMFGPADLTNGFVGPRESLAETVFGTYDLRKASPVSYVSADDPPFLILQGDRDDTNPLTQSRELYDRLADAGVPAQLIIVHGGDHGLTVPDEQPSRAEITHLMVEFFEKHLK